MENINLEALSVEDLVELVNKLKAQGMSVAQIQKKYNVRDKYISDKIRIRYKLEKTTNQYVLRDMGSCEVTPSNAMLPEVRNEEKVGLVTPGNTVFTEEHIDILHRLISEYKVRQLIQEDADEDKGKTINRNIRVYEKQYEIFSTWCKENNCTQADALHKAINLLMQKS